MSIAHRFESWGWLGAMTVAFVLLTGAASPAGAAFVEETGSPIGVGSSPWWAGTGDFNGDGRPDVAVANDDPASPTGTVSILLRQPLGGFAAETPLSVGQRPDALAAADLNGDGRIDLAVSNYLSATVSVLLRRADNTGFDPEGAPVAVGSGPHAVAAGDFNADGRIDLATPNFVSSTVTVLLRKADNSGFVEEAGSPIDVGTNPTQVALADFDGNGRLDIAAANHGSDNVTVLLRKADNTGFAAEAATPAAGDAPAGIATADFNGDARPDLAVAAEVSDDVTVLLGQAGGGFVAPAGSPYPAGDGAYGVVTGNFNGDTVTDLAATAFTANSVTVLHGTGAGGFQEAPSAPLPTAKSPLVLAAADFDANGRDDLAIPNNGASTLTVRLSQPDPVPAPVPAAPAGCTPPTAGRVALWRGEDNARDSAGALDGSLENFAGYRDGVLGRAFSLAGNDDYVHLPDRPDLDLTGDLTLDAWVRLDDLTWSSPDPYGVGGDRVFFSKVAGDRYATFAFWLETDGKTSPTASLRFMNGDSASAGAFVESDELTWAADTWYHVAVTRRGRDVVFYRDGNPVATAALGQDAVSSPRAPLALGGAVVDATLFNPLKGGLDEPEVWNRALSADEVKALDDTATGACATPQPTPTPTPTETDPPPTPAPTPQTTSAPDAVISRPVIVGRLVTFDASASTNVERFRWDLTGDGKADIDCGERPEVTTSLDNLSADRTVLLVADGSSGTSDTATATAPRLPTALRRARAAQAAKRSRYADFAECDGANRADDLTQDGGPPAHCPLATNPQRLIFGVVEADGCFDKIRAGSSLPPAVVDALRREVATNAELRSYMGGVIAGGDGARASQDDTVDLGTAVDLGEFWTSKLPVRVNGVDFYPAAGTEVIVAAALRLVILKKGNVRLEGALLDPPGRDASVTLDVSEPARAIGVPNGVRIGEVSMRALGVGAGAVKAPTLGGFPLTPNAEVRFLRLADGRRIARITGQIALAGSGLTDEDGRAPTIPAVLVANNREALAQLPLEANLARTYAGRWPMRNGVLRFDPPDAAAPASKLQPPAPLQCNGDLGEGPVWSMGADLLLSLASGVGLRLEPTPKYGICFQNGRFKSAGAGLDLPVGCQGETCVGIPVVGPFVWLDHVGMNFQIEPSELRGYVEMHAVKVFEIDGAILASFPNAEHPTTLIEGNPLPIIPSIARNREFKQAVFGVGGTLKFLGIDLANAAVVYAYPELFGLAARVGRGFPEKDPIVSLTGSVDGGINFEYGKFNLVGNVTGCVVSICESATGVISSVGAGACVSLFGGEINVGGGVQWPAKVYLWPFDGCKWTRFYEANVNKARTAQAGTISIVVAPSEAGRSRAIELRGADDAPLIRVIGPDGEVAELAPGADNNVVNDRLELERQAGSRPRIPIRILRSSAHKITTVGLQNPKAGTYRIERLDASAEISSYATALDPPDARIAVDDVADLKPLARVAAHAAQAGKRPGRRVALTYDIRRRQAQTVTFLDGGNIVGEVKGGGRGSVQITLPEDGRMHPIVARFALNGVTVPGEDKVVARIRVPRPPAARVRSLRATRRGTTLTIRWRGNASRYAVVMREHGGRMRSIITRATSLRITVKRSQAGTVSVRGINRLEARGRARVVRFRAAGRPINRFRPYGALRRG